MYEWRRQVQQIADRIDRCIADRDDDGLALRAVAAEIGYSEYYATRKFKEISGVSFRDYLRGRRLAYALIDLRDTKKSILEIAMDYGFSSHEAFCRSFKALYGIPPSTYRAKPKAVVLRTRIVAFDRYYFGLGEIGMLKSTEEIKVYFVSIPAHKFLHIKNYDSDGYFDFWEKQDAVPGMDCDTICGLLDSVKGKLDGEDGVIGQFSGQIMARLYEGGKGADANGVSLADGNAGDNIAETYNVRIPDGNTGGRSAEAYGVRLPVDHAGECPQQMLLLDVPAGEYVVFEHGKFDYEQESESVGAKLQSAIDGFDYGKTEYAPDCAPGRLSYFYFDPEKYEKRVLPVKRKNTP